MTVTRARQAENRFETWTDWRGYLKFLEAIGDRPIRVTYDRGRLELMSPTKEHEKVKKTLACLLETMMIDAQTAFEPGGSMTFKREDLDRGLEPDECYWVASYEAVCDKNEFDPATDPPPDLVIEVEVSRSMINRLGIYQAMGVPEIWRWTRRGRLEFHHRELDERYVVRTHSTAFPWLSSDEVAAFVRRGRKEGVSVAAAAFRDRVRVLRERRHR